MPDSIIEVNNLSKSYIISHEGRESYTALRDVMAQKAKKIFSFPRSFSPSFGGRQREVEEFWALKDVSFKIEQGDRVGIIGRNGAGKSTLLKILSRITEPTGGEIKLKGRVASLLEVGTGFHPELTGRENIFLNGAILGMSRMEIKKHFDAIVDFSGVEKFLDTPVKRYSSGMYVRLAFAVAAHLEPEILIVDEVLAVGDAEFQKKCMGKMEEVSKNEGRTVLFVSHNMSAINELCSRGIYMVDGGINFSGSIDMVIGKYVSGVQTNRITFDAFLKYVEIEQKQGNIFLNAEYETEYNLDIPNLGFVIKNSLGVPITGSNSLIDVGIPENNTFYKNKGKIELLITEPKLLDGTYTVSIWFGNSKEEFLTAHDCLSFDVASMSRKKQLQASKVGNIFPVCQWTFK